MLCGLHGRKKCIIYPINLSVTMSLDELAWCMQKKNKKKQDDNQSQAERSYRPTGVERQFAS